MARADADRAARLAGHNRSSGACLNASGRTVRNRAATRTVLTALRTILAYLAHRSEKLEPLQLLAVF